MLSNAEAAQTENIWEQNMPPLILLFILAVRLCLDLGLNSVRGLTCVAIEHID